MRPIRLLLYVLAAQLLITACQKELNSTASTISSGVLLADISHNCLPSIVNGIYHADSSFNNTHYIDVQVNAITAGTYLVRTDTVNGYSFKGEGTFTATGLNMIRLYPSGHTFSEGLDTFTVNYGTSSCSVKVTVIGSSTGNAVFTLGGAPGACSGASASGIYEVGVPLDPSNSIQLDVNVSVPGIYSLTAAGVNGMSFSGSGVFVNTGLQSVTLQASGTPVAAGPVNLEVTNPVTNEFCSFTIVVLPAGTGVAVYTFESSAGSCSGAVTNGTYQAGLVTTASNTVTVQVNVTATGTYTIATNSVNGISFSGSGAFSATGVQPVVLTASGTPVTSGASGFTVSNTTATSACSFTINVMPAGSGSAVFTLETSAGACSGAVVNGTYEAGVGVLAGLNTVTLFVNVTTVGTFSISSNVVNGLSFSRSGSFTATGVQQVVLTASGTPVASGILNFLVSTGTSTCTFSLTVNPTAANAQLYIPMTTNSNWTYQLQGATTTDTIRVKVLPDPVIYNSTSYRVFKDMTRNTSNYLRHDGGKYYTYFLDFFDPGSTINVESLILDTALAVNTTWSTNLGNIIVGGIPLALRYDYQILEKGASATIGQVTYNNIIKVKSSFMVDQGTGFQLSYLTEDWYARGYGKVYYKTNEFVLFIEEIYKVIRLEIY